MKAKLTIWYEVDIPIEFEVEYPWDKEPWEMLAITDSPLYDIEKRCIKKAEKKAKKFSKWIRCGGIEWELLEK